MRRMDDLGANFAAFYGTIARPKPRERVCIYYFSFYSTHFLNYLGVYTIYINFFAFYLAVK